MSKVTHKLVDGVVVELTPEEIAELEPSEPKPEPKQEKPDARSRPRR